jgi:uncharacterized membrane protein
VLVAASAVPLTLASLLDGAAWVSGRDIPPSPAAALSWLLLAVGIAIACCVLLARVLQRNRWQPAHVRTLRLGVVLELLAVGMLLGSLILRGQREIPPDPPLLMAQVLALLFVAAADQLRARAARAGADRGYQTAS